MSIGLNKLKQIIKTDGIKTVSEKLNVSTSLLYQLNNETYNPMSMKMLTVYKIRDTYAIEVNDWRQLTL
ncbi:MAG: hypothetical protein PF693_09955 [Spirochaetia bacterium]|jgi:hypothetical protein|nr:hypothetical protein [Spirochaetia bacterium]